MWGGGFASSIVGFKQMVLQSGFKCSGWLNMSNFTSPGIPDRRSSTEKLEERYPNVVNQHTLQGPFAVHYTDPGNHWEDASLFVVVASVCLAGKNTL